MPDDVNGGIKTSHWFWGAAQRLQHLSLDKKQVQADEEIPGVRSDVVNTPKSADEELNDIVLQNPQASGAALVNAMKANGLSVVKATEAKVEEPKKFDDCVDKVKSKGGDYNAYAVCHSALGEVISRLKGDKLKLPKKMVPKKEADSSSSMTPLLVKEAKFKFSTTKLQESSRDDGIGPTKFKVVLLQEGLGNLGDAYYYSREALDSAVTIFTGTKIYADHPSLEEEQIRPERSVRDVLGHFENIQIEEDKSGRGMLTGDVDILPHKSFEWARGLMIRAIENAKKFPDKHFVGLSINASGDAEEISVDEVLKAAPESAKPKLIQAKENGIDTVKIVRLIKSAISCDLVTEAGAGGEIISTIENRE